MKHAEHRAKKATARLSFPLAMFVAPHGSHSAHIQERVMNVSTGDGAVVGLTQDLAEQLQSKPLSRRSLRLAKRSAERRNRMVVSTSMLALVGAVATAMVATKHDDMSLHTNVAAIGSYPASQETVMSSASRSSARTSLHGLSERNEGLNSSVTSVDGTAVATTSSPNTTWNLGSDSSFNVAELSRSAANNPQVARLMDEDVKMLPSGFNPNHGTGDVGNAYAFSQCTWWVYLRRHQLGLPVGSHMGNGNMWANSARRLGYWVDRKARHVGDIMVFQAGQAGTDPFYGHVAVVEKINPDGSIETSECGAAMAGRTYSRTYAANEISSYEFIHY